MSPSAICCCSSILATASASPSTRATSRKSSTSTRLPASLARAKAPLARISKPSLILRRTGKVRRSPRPDPVGEIPAPAGKDPNFPSLLHVSTAILRPSSSHASGRTPTIAPFVAITLSCREPRAICLLFSIHGKPFLQRRRWHPWRSRPFPPRRHHGLSRRILRRQSSQRCRFLLELFRREHFWHHPGSHAFRRRLSVLERSQHRRLDSYPRRFTLHPRGRTRQHAHLFPPHQSFQHSRHAGSARRRTRPHRPLPARSSPFLTPVPPSISVAAHKNSRELLQLPVESHCQHVTSAPRWNKQGHKGTREQADGIL